MYNVLLFHGNNGYANARQCYITPTLPVVFKITDSQYIRKGRCQDVNTVFYIEMNA